MIAGLSLNIFNNHADRVRMANIAQMVNVIQSLILTRGKEMVVTPTWHVFDLYKVHQGATQIPVDVDTPDYVQGTTRLPTISASASRDAAGKLHLSIVNLDPTSPPPSTWWRAACPVGARRFPRSPPTGSTGRWSSTARSLSTDAGAGIAINGDRVTLTVPARSVTMVTVE